MKIDLVSIPNDIPKILWTAVRTCKSPKTPDELFKEAEFKDFYSMNQLILRVLKSGHLSIAEHCSITYTVSGVSRALLAQLSRHRIGVSPSVQSQRFVAWDGDMVHPPSVLNNPEAEMVANGLYVAAQDCYDELRSLGIPKEDARYYVLGGATTNFVLTVNLRSLYDLWVKRSKTPGAQWEIKELVNCMVDKFLFEQPWLLDLFEGFTYERKD